MLLNNEPAAAQVILRSIQNSSGDDIIRYRAEQLMDQVKNQQQVERDLRTYDGSRRVETTVPDEPPKLARNNEGVARPAEDGVIETAKLQTRIPEGTRVEGALTQVDCANGITLRLRVGNTTIDLHTDDPAHVEFVSYVQSVKDSFSCGKVDPEIPIAVIYKRTADHRFLGELIRVEFVAR